MRPTVALVVLLAMPGMAVAEDAAPKPKSAPKICRSIDKPGSHLETRVCKTKAQWDEEDALNDVTNGDFETRGNRVVTSRIINTGTGGGLSTGAPK